LVPGHYRLDTYVEAGGESSDRILRFTQLNVIDGDFYQSGYCVFEKESKFLINGTFSFQDLH